MNRKPKYHTVVMATYIALLPPIWAVFSSFVGITTGAAALIAASIYGANGNKAEDAVKISIGFLLGDSWAYGSTAIINHFHGSAVVVFITLAILGFLAVIIADLTSKFIYLPAWLGGWAIGITILNRGGHLNTMVW